MIVDMISDLHGFQPKLEGGDLLIVAGDLTASDQPEQYFEFAFWLSKQDYKRIIIIGGNHDNFLASDNPLWKNMLPKQTEYLCDSGTEFEYEEDVEEEHKFKGMISYKVKKKLKIFGSPWTKTFPGMNPHCKAFTVDTEEELAEKWKLIPHDTDILITHSPPEGILDKCPNGNVGSKSLRRIMERVKPKLWICGHIHESYGEFKDITLSGVQYHIVNASYVNERYKPVNKPVRMLL